MKSYVRDHVKSIVSIYESKRRVDVVRNGVLCRFTEEDFDIMKRVADHFGISKTAACEMLLQEAIRDAAEELGLWRPEEDEPSAWEDTEE